MDASARALQKAMKDFENYECDNQLSLDDLYPKTCCGVVPWLRKTKVFMDGREEEQLWIMHYICPLCKKVPVDNTGWTIRSKGTAEVAAAEALKVWNDPNIKHENRLYKPDEKLSVPWDRVEEFKEMYGESIDYR